MLEVRRCAEAMSVCSGGRAVRQRRQLQRREAVADIRKSADLNNLALVEGKHISDDGVTLYNDLLYRLLLNNDQLAYLYLAHEHQRGPLHTHASATPCAYGVRTAEWTSRRAVHLVYAKPSGRNYDVRSSAVVRRLA